MKLQTIFNRVKKHLLKQNEKALTDMGKCRYKAKSGLKCAIGCLIHKKYYDEDIEDNGASEYLVRQAVAKSLKLQAFDEDNVLTEMLGDLQYIHDMTPTFEWSMKLKEYKENHSKLLKHIIT